jgi:hypothetical protein
MRFIEKLEIGSGAALKELFHTIEYQYAKCFCHGVLVEAYGKLHVAKGEVDSYSLIVVSFKIGGLMVLLLWYINNTLLSSSAAVDFFLMKDPSIYIYAVVGSLITYKWLWGYNVWIWNSVNIDYITLLHLDNPKHMPSCADIFSEAATLSICYLLNILVYHTLKREHENGGKIYMPVYYPPLTLVIATCGYFLYSISMTVSYGIFSKRVFKNVSLLVS